jgi:phosphate transport system permease protein
MDDQMVSTKQVRADIPHRVRRNAIWMAGLTLATACVIIPLLAVIVMVIKNGVMAFSPEMILRYSTDLTAERNAFISGFVGSSMLIMLASILALPLSLSVGVLFVEYPRHIITYGARICVDIIQGAPSIVIGIIIYIWLVKPFGQFSAFAGAVALAVIMMPITIRSTEEALKNVPIALKEASLSLGVPYFRTIYKVVIPNGIRGIVSGSCIAIARISGETAPLLFTILGTPFISFQLSREIGALSLMIYHNAMSQYPIYQTIAWGGALVLMTMNILLIAFASWINRDA